LAVSEIHNSPWNIHGHFQYKVWCCTLHTHLVVSIQGAGLHPSHTPCSFSTRCHAAPITRTFPLKDV
jgi:hypothetical protein